MKKFRYIIIALSILIATLNITDHLNAQPEDLGKIQIIKNDLKVPNNESLTLIYSREDGYNLTILLTYLNDYKFINPLPVGKYKLQSASFPSISSTNIEIKAPETIEIKKDKPVPIKIELIENKQTTTEKVITKTPTNNPKITPTNNTITDNNTSTIMTEKPVENNNAKSNNSNFGLLISIVLLSFLAIILVVIKLKNN